MPKNDHYFPKIISAVAILSLIIVFIYIVFFNSYFSGIFTSSQSANVNNVVYHELGYDPLITIVPEDLQNQGEKSKFLISSIDPRWGDENAKVVMLVWSQFSDGNARQVADNINALRNEYANENLIIIWKDLVNPDDKENIVWQAASAAHCANEDSLFWQYHNLLFNNVEDLTADRLNELADEAGINTETFNQCLIDKEFEALISTNYYKAGSNGISEAPTVYVNSNKIDDPTDLEKLKAVINENLNSYE